MQTIPSTENLEFKDKFIERYSQLTDWDEFKRYSFSFLRRSIRVNTLQRSVNEVKKSVSAKGWRLQPIPWCKLGFWISHPGRKDVGNLLEHHLGQFYVQEAASMIPPLVLNPKPGEVVLDMAAAPGSKTTQMAVMMENTGIIVANDYKGQRLQSLGINIQRSVLTNVILTLMDGNRFHNFQFDKILLDAPCSGTGTIRKSLKTVSIWNPAMITKLAKQQQKLISNAFRNLKPGGEMVYSTCSLEPEENEGVIDYLLHQFPDADILPVKLAGLKTSPPIQEFNNKKYDSRVSRSLRIWPQDNDTEGFFVAKLRKKSSH
jgi:tRNA (cytosine49-C5)-methyltransferase